MAMPLEIVTIPCLQDNYAFLAHCSETATTTLVDIPEAAPILAELDKRSWALNQILITHHHWDHVEGLADVLAVHKATVFGSNADKDRLPALDVALNEGDTMPFGAEAGHVIDVSGHTIHHIAVHVPSSRVVFTADSLMALGCGRVFEGTHDQMWASLQKLAALPEDTLVCSGHEYTAANGRFAVTIEPNNAALNARISDIADKRSKDQPTVPSLLSLELATNPFLRAGQTALKEQLGMENRSDAEVFSEIRTRKDNF